MSCFILRSWYKHLIQFKLKKILTPITSFILSHFIQLTHHDSVMVAFVSCIS